MPTADIRADYQVLEEIATTFGNESERVQRVYSQLDTTINKLKKGGWVSDAADTFYREMDEVILRSMQRLADALAQAAEVTLEIETTFKAAEEVAAANLQADDMSPISNEKDDGTRFRQIFQEEIPPIIFDGDEILQIFDAEGEQLPFSIPEYPEAEFDQAVLDYLTEQFHTEDVDWGWFEEHQPADTTANNAMLSALLSSSSNSGVRAATVDGGGWLAALVAFPASNPGWVVMAAMLAARAVMLEMMASSQQRYLSTLFSESTPNSGDDALSGDGQSGNAGAAAGQSASPGYTDGSGYRVDPVTGEQVVDPQNLPADPNDLLQHGWQEVTDPRAIASPTYNGRREFVDPQTGQRISFDPGTAGAHGWAGRDHYHVYNPNSTNSSDLYLDRNGNPVRRGSRESHILPEGN